MLKVHPHRQAPLETSSQEAILDAATHEFAWKGFAGTRVHAIADEAGVNIALLYYYFETKEKLYAAVLERLFEEWALRVTAALEREGTPGQKLIAYVQAYFDFIAEAPYRPRLVQQEMTQLGTSATQCVTAFAIRYVRPVHRMLIRLLNDGCGQGEFRRVSPDFVHTISASIVSYFTSSTFIQAMTGHDPLTPAKVAERRNSVLDTISTALFTSSRAGIRHKEGHK